MYTMQSEVNKIKDEEVRDKSLTADWGRGTAVAACDRSGDALALAVSNLT